MSNESLSISLGKSLIHKVVDPFIDTGEILLDSVINEDRLKEYPIIKYVYTAYKIVDDSRGRYHLHKLKLFCDQLNEDMLKDGVLERYKEKLAADDAKMNQELDYILILLDRYIEYDKPRMLANLYWAYLKRNITWDEFAAYSIVVDRFLPGDFTKLREKETHITYHNNVPASILRLVALGLVDQIYFSSPFITNGRGGMMVTGASTKDANNQRKDYRRTEFGNKLIGIIRYEVFP